MGRKEQQELQSKLLDTTTAGLVLALLYYKPELFNPWQLTAWQWLAGLVGIRAALTFYDHLVIFVIDNIFHSKLLPTRTTGTPVRYVGLDTKSIIFLTINNLHEWLFVQRLCHFIWYSPKVAKDWHEIDLWNTVGALYLMFIVLDSLYAPCHHILHMPFLYPLIHKHHHRQHFPTRGYLDAGNEHPIEHLIGVLAVWGAVLAAVHGPTGAHGVTLFFFFNIHASLAILNHSPYQVQFSILPGKKMTYSVGYHEMHHRKFTVNYAQYLMWYDRLMKTFAPYENPSQKLQQAKAQ